MGFPGGASGKNPAAYAGDIRDTVQSLGPEGPLEDGMATRSNILAWRMSWTEKTARLHSIVSQRVRHDRRDLACTHPY